MMILILSEGKLTILAEDLLLIVRIAVIELVETQLNFTFECNLMTEVTSNISHVLTGLKVLCLMLNLEERSAFIIIRAFNPIEFTIYFMILKSLIF